MKELSRLRERVIAAKREVRATQSEDGLRTLIARGEAGDVVMLLALHQRVAEMLGRRRRRRPAEVRMSKAMGWIANPAHVLDLLARHAGDPDPTGNRGNKPPPTKPIRPIRGPMASRRLGNPGTRQLPSAVVRRGRLVDPTPSRSTWTRR